MVCSADDLLEWKGFPKGLRVLLLDEDDNSAAEIKLKLEEMDYVVSTFHNEDEALKAISNKCENFHVAIVEVSTGNSLGSFKFLENAKDLPTIMTSNIHCLSTMMKCIAHGAAEFLQKPLSEDKLKNIWQHVVHKVFNAGEEALSESMKPVKETVVSMLHLKLENNSTDQVQNESQKLLETVDIEASSAFELCDHHNEQSMTTDKFPAPSTPQLKQSGRFSDDGDCQESTQDQPNNNSSMDQEHGELADGECSKSVDTTCNNSSVNHPQVTITSTSNSNVVDDALIIKEEKKSSPGDPITTESNFSSQLKPKDGVKDSNAESRNRKKTSLHPNSCGSRANRKKMKVDWTADLHKRFVQAVEQLGVDQAIPSRILELMKAEGLTRHNVASHLQKYRLNRRHILPKEDHHHHQDRIRWQTSPSMQRPTTNYHQHQYNKPIMAYPSLPLPNYHHSLAHHPQVCHVWGHPAATSNHQMWGHHHPGFPAWQHPTTSTSYPTAAAAAAAAAVAAAAGFHQMNVDGWGNPVNLMPTLSHQVPCTTNYPHQVQNLTGYQCLDPLEDHSNNSMMGNMISSFHLHPQEGDCNVAAAADYDDDEEKLIFIDKVVKEAMSKPWLPLPLGLNPPSTESVLNELQRQGIPNIPPLPHPPKHHHQVYDQ